MMPDIETIETAFEHLYSEERTRLIALLERHGWDRGIRIFMCMREHVAGVRCICGAQDKDAATA